MNKSTAKWNNSPVSYRVTRRWNTVGENPVAEFHLLDLTYHARCEGAYRKFQNARRFEISETRNRQSRTGNWYNVNNQPRRQPYKSHPQTLQGKANVPLTGTAVVLRITALITPLPIRLSQHRRNDHAERETLRTFNPHLFRLLRQSRQPQFNPRRQTSPVIGEESPPDPRVRRLVDQQTPTFDDDVRSKSVYEAQN